MVDEMIPFSLGINCGVDMQNFHPVHKQEETDKAAKMDSYVSTVYCLLEQGERSIASGNTKDAFESLCEVRSDMDCEYTEKGNSAAFDEAIYKKLTEAEAEARTIDFRLSHGEVSEGLRACLANNAQQTP